MKRWLYSALILLALCLILASQPWVSIQLTTGKNLQFSGFEAYPFIGSALLADILAIALVLYIHRRWGFIFLVAGGVALVLAAIAQLPLALLNNQSVVNPMIEKATGIATWLAQLESVVISRQTTFVGSLNWVVYLAVAVVQTLAVFDILRKAKTAAPLKRATRESATSDAPDSSSLWSETNPH